MQCVVIFSYLLFSCLSLWFVTEASAQWNSCTRTPPASMLPHILQDQNFWKIYADELLTRKTWKCSFPSDILMKDIHKDAKLYDDENLFLKRRHKMNDWVKNDTLWAEIVYQTSKELSQGVTDGKFSKELREIRVLDALTDFIHHLHYFREVARIMEEKGEAVIVQSQRSSVIHDIDKLDPVMLVGYSEKFDDNRTTSLWDECVYRHTHINPHHQAYCIWQNCCDLQNRTECEIERGTALNEMVCDKVSRRLQKNLEGKISSAMWDVDLKFYDGLPDTWLSRAEALMEKMKRKE